MPHLRKNLEFLEENIEMKRLELETVQNLVLVQRWADYSLKYGVGYKLTSGNYGVLFNDRTSLLERNDPQQTFTYVSSQDKREQTYSSGNCPKFLEKKMTLIKSFRAYIEKTESNVVEVPAYLETRE